MQHRSTFTMPIRTWEALDQAVNAIDRRLATVEGKTAVLLTALTIATTSNLATLALVVHLTIRGG